MKPARSGHRLLPCSKFKEVSATKPTGYPVDRLQPRPDLTLWILS